MEAGTPAHSNRSRAAPRPAPARRATLASLEVALAIEQEEAVAPAACERRGSSLDSSIRCYASVRAAPRAGSMVRCYLVQWLRRELGARSSDNAFAGCMPSVLPAASSCARGRVGRYSCACHRQTRATYSQKNVRRRLHRFQALPLGHLGHLKPLSAAKTWPRTSAGSRCTSTLLVWAAARTRSSARSAWASTIRRRSVGQSR